MFQLDGLASVLSSFLQQQKQGGEFLKGTYQAVWSLHEAINRTELWDVGGPLSSLNAVGLNLIATSHLSAALSRKESQLRIHRQCSLYFGCF